jgi:hypothetical protein
VTSSTLDSELKTWRASDAGARIDYAGEVIDELAIAATEGFNRLPHGGVEIGGVLFGIRTQEGVKVLAQRAVDCEHALGPSFTLSENDRSALEELLRAPASDPELSGLQPVGWYLCHNRSGLAPAEKDVQLFDRYFPEPWQITLVLRPNRFEPVRACFFRREPDGSLHTPAADDEFIIRPCAVAPELPPIPAPAPVAVVHAPRTGPAPVRERPRRRMWIAAALAGVAAGAVFWVAGGRTPSPLSLRALDVGGQLQIDWTCSPRILPESDGGAIEIEDGEHKVVSVLSPEQLRSGSLTYMRTTGNVLTRLTVRGKNRTTLTQMARFLGSPPVLVAAATAPVASVGSAERSAPRDEPRRPVERDPARVKPPEPPKSYPPKPDPPPPPVVRHELVVPAIASADAPDPSVPPPPSIAAITLPAIETTIPRLPAPAPPSPVKRAEPLPRTGNMIWTGRLARGGTIQIFTDRPSAGHLSGALPGGPVQVRVFPAELTQDGLRVFTSDPKSVSVPEAPGAQNGWNRTIYVLNPRQADDIRVIEAPNRQNGWKQMTLRAERADHTIVVLRWERIAAGEQ